MAAALTSASLVLLGPGVNTLMSSEIEEGTSSPIVGLSKFSTILLFEEVEEVC